MIPSPTHGLIAPKHILTGQPTTVEQPFETLTRLVQGFSNTNAQTWWSLTGPILGRLMSSANYDVQTQYACLIFHLYNVVPRLGPAPGTEGNQNWRSFMCDDFSPLEYSWNWSSDKIKKPKIRYSVELIGPDAGTPKDPYNRSETLELCTQLRKDLPKADWKLFDIMCDAFYNKTITNSNNNKVHSDQDTLTSSPSSLFLAFELGSTISTKAYFMPTKFLQDSTPPLHLLSTAISKLRASGHTCGGYESLLRFLSTPAGSDLDLIIVAIDCFESTTSRFKIYMRSPHTSFASVLSNMTLGGTQPLPALAAQNLKDLWHSTLSLPLTFPASSPLPLRTHQTSGILYNFDLSLSSSSISPKLYIPLKHYAKSDGEAARGLSGYLEKRGMGEWVGRYMGALGECSTTTREETGVGKVLDETRGRQTYIGVSVGKTGELGVCNYVGGGVYC